MRNVIKHRIIKIKSQPKWLVRIFVLLGTVLGGVFAFVSHPIIGTNAENIECPEGQHTEDGETCIDDEQQVPCTQTGEIPANSVYNVVNVTGIWNSGTNTWDIPNCSWMCKTNNDTQNNTNNTNTGREDITICNPNDSNACIILMDRNLGAINTGTNTASSTIGNYYEWGNNYGFTSSKNPNITSTKVPWDDKYNNSGYYGIVFITSTSEPVDYWSDNQNHPGLRGGANDHNDNRGYNTTNMVATNLTGRQGPCPDGYHVPSVGEWGTLIKYRANTYATGISIGIYPFYNINTNSLGFRNQFNLSVAGNIHNYHGTITNVGTEGSYWTSSTSGSRAVTLKLTSNSISLTRASFASGRPIRCFKNAGNVTEDLNNSYHTEDGLSCTLNTKKVECTQEGKPDHSSYTAGNVSVTWSGTWNTGEWSQAANCPWSCDEHYTENTGNNTCEVSTTTVGCDATEMPAHAIATNPTVTVEWDFDSGDWADPVACDWMCSTGYHTEDGLSCTLNTKEVECTQEGKPAHSTYITGDVNITWSGTWNTGEWTAIENCAYSCDAGYELDQSGYCKKSNVQVTFVANPTTFSDGRFSGSVTSKTLEYFFVTGGYYAAVTEEIQIPQNPHEYDSSGNLLTGWMFEGWYLDTGYSAASRWTGLNANTTYTGITLYARYLPFKDKTVTMDVVTFTIMDRNMGALDYSSGYSYDNEQSNRSRAGLFFQWGNNFGFPNTGTLENTVTGTLIENFTNKSRGPGNYYFNGTFVESTGYRDSLTTGNGNLRGGNDINTPDINKQGPCPEGYHIPVFEEWNSALTLFNEWENIDDGSGYCNSLEQSGYTYCFSAKIGLPFAGHRYHMGFAFTQLRVPGTLGVYWSASPFNEKYILDLYISNSTIVINDTSEPARGFSLRCFKDTTGVTLSYDSKGGTAVASSTERRWFAKSTAPANPTRTNSTFVGWYRDTGYTDEFIFSGDTYISEDTTIYAKWSCDTGYKLSNDGQSCVPSKDIILQATVTEANQTLKINKYFNNAYTVDRGDGSAVQNLTADTTHTYNTAGTYTIILSLSGTATRWTFQNVGKPLVPKNGTTMTGVKITFMPSLAEGFGNSATEPGDYFFYRFNSDGAITSLPEGSFDISYISGAVGNRFFSTFNNGGALISLPEGSFDTSNIESVGDYFFAYFNNGGALISLPEGSFDTSKIESVGDNFFSCFNSNGALTSLPTGSFDTSKIKMVGSGFFTTFNQFGSLITLPEGSFDISNISGTIGDSFFSYFNAGGSLTSLPGGSFRLGTGLTIVGNNFFNQFNYSGTLTSLPTLSFNTSNITSVGGNFFYAFNAIGYITSLPEGSFRTESITTAGDGFFSYFNYGGKITSLPEGSFRTENITTVGSDFFYTFNYIGAIESLPDGSFDTSHITTAGDNFFCYFNYGGRLTSLPDSFKLTSAAYDKTGGYQNAFNSPNYTLNKNVSDLVSGVTAPSNDRNTFSDNQSKRCGVDPNWLVTTADACSITYNSNGGSTIANPTKKYTADTTSVVAGSGITTPTRAHSQFVGWYTGIQTGNQVTTVLFPAMDSGTLYAFWSCDTGYKISGDACILNKDIVLQATATAANQSLKINKYFANAYTVDRGDGSAVQNLTADTTHTYTTAGTYTITLSLAGTASRWTFQNIQNPLVPRSGTMVTGVKITYMPSLAEGFGDSATAPGDYFFAYFNGNKQGASDGGVITTLPAGSFDISSITTAGNYFFAYFNAHQNNQNYGFLSLPAGSFDISNITTVGDYFFYNFNWYGRITSLPVGSFRLSTGLTTVGNNFFSSFNYGGSLTSLPVGSFNTENIIEVGNYFFSNFNYSNGAVTSLPAGSFDISNITTVGNYFFSSFNGYGGRLTNLPAGSFRLSTGLTTVGNYFFYYFNYNGGKITLPAGSFNTENIITVGDDFFSKFNAVGKITSLPAGSFNTENIITVGKNFFYYFNWFGDLTSLPAGSFDISNITKVGDNFFRYFNADGKLTSLPEGSFRLSTGLTTVGNYFFSSFNGLGQTRGGDLASLPTGSFNLENIITVGNYFFSSFNSNGKLTSLPAGSFRFSTGLTTIGNYFFSSFNKSGALTSLPDSFKLNSLAYNKSNGYTNAFNSPNYTLNKNVSDLVSGVTAPTSDRNTFSDNQPGRCGVDPNWLVSTANACSITYDSNGGSTIANPTQLYTADTTGVVAGSGITTPTRANYAFDGWYNASVGGTKIITVTFPSMDSGTLYAHWRETVPPTVTISSEGIGMCVVPGTVYTVTGSFSEAVTGINASTLSVSGGTVQSFNMISDTEAVRTVSAGGAGSSNIHYGSGTITICDQNDARNCITIMDRNLGATTNDITNTGSYGNYYQRGNNYGFPNNENVTIGNQQIDCSIYNPLSPFSTGTFIIGTSSPFDYCISKNDNLWGGENDEFDLDERSPANSYPLTSESAVSRKGPCPTDYHVPSQGEWFALMDIRAGTGVNGYAEDGEDFSISKFYTDLHIPLAGIRYNDDGFIAGQGIRTHLWSSSPDADYVRNFHILLGNFVEAIDSNKRTYGFSVRCFKDTPIIPDDNDGTLTVIIETGLFVDLAGNANTTGSNTISWEYDAQGPTLPTLSSPVNSGFLNTLKPTLSWNDDTQGAGCNTGKGGYEIWVCTDSGCDTAVQSKIYDTNTTTWALPTNLTNGTKYYWKVRSKDGLGNWGEWSSIWSFTVDATAPVCSWGEPSKECIKAGESGTITLTCIDSVGVSTNILNSGAITYSGTLFTLTNATVGGTATSRTFQFTYTSKNNVNGGGKFILPANTVKDTVGNSAVTTGSSVITVDTTAPSTTASGIPSSWTGSNVTVSLNTSTSNMGCNSTHTTYYCVDTANTCTPNTTGISVSVECAAGSKCTKYVRYYSKDGLGNTESVKSGTVKIDKEGPTYTFANNSGAECTAGSLSITSASDNNGVGLASSAYKFGGGSWGTATSTGIAARQPGSVIATGYVRDSLGNETVKTATYTFNNVAPTANNFTVDDVLTGKTVNWKALSNAIEGNCGSGSLTAVLKTNASSSMGACTVNGDNISFAAAQGSDGTATCVITIKDDENSETDITVTWNGVSRPIPQISFVDPTPVQDSVITQNRFTTKMNITNADYIKNFEYEYNGTKYDLMSGLILMYNFDNVESIGESSTVVKDLSNNGYDGTVHGATWTSNGAHGGAYSFDGVDDYIEFPDYGPLNQNGTVSARVKGDKKWSIIIGNVNGLGIGINSELKLMGSVGFSKPMGIIKGYNVDSWNHIVVSLNDGIISYYINGNKLEEDRNNSINWNSIGQGRIGGRDYSGSEIGLSPYSGQIDEIRVYNRALSQEEIQFLYKSNMKKTSENTWEFETLNTCLVASGTYNYTGKVVSSVDTQASTGRNLTTNIPNISVGTLGYHFGTYEATGTVRTLTGSMGYLTVNDYIGRSGRIVYFAASNQLVGQNLGETIDTENLKFKANTLIYSGLYDGVSNALVSLGNGISTTEYISAKSSCTNESCTNYDVVEYMTRLEDPNDFMCGNVGTYSENVYIKLDIPSWQVQDLYQGRLWITLQQN